MRKSKREPVIGPVDMVDLMFLMIGILMVMMLNANFDKYKNLAEIPVPPNPPTNPSNDNIEKNQLRCEVDVAISEKKSIIITGDNGKIKTIECNKNSLESFKDCDSQNPLIVADIMEGFITDCGKNSIIFNIRGHRDADWIYVFPAIWAVGELETKYKNGEKIVQGNINSDPSWGQLLMENYNTKKGGGYL
jgi:hypothetical protein